MARHGTTTAVAAVLLAGWACVAVARPSLFDALHSVQFRNEGVTTSNDTFFWEVITPAGPGQVAIYLEADNVSCTKCVWSDGGKYYQEHPYLFRGPVGPASFKELGDLDWDGVDVLVDGSSNHKASERDCEAQCAALPACRAGLFINGTVRHGECWLAASVLTTPRHDFCGAAPGQSCQSFALQHSNATKYSGATPASGMRSAVPLGGLSAGTVELRGDGSLHEFTIHNAGPGGAAKIQSYPAFYFAMAVDGEARVLQTHPLASPELARAGVGALQYSGSHPVSRLQVVADTPPGADRRSMLRPGALDLSADLFGYSALVAGSMNASSRPAVAFTLAVSNPGAQASNVSFSVNLPFNIEVDQARVGTALPGKGDVPVQSAEACYAACHAEPACLSWVFNQAASTCALQSDVPLNEYRRGLTSGVDGDWVVWDEQQCLVLRRNGTGPMHGELALCATADASGAGVHWASAVGNDPALAFKALQKQGGLRPGAAEPAGAYGSVAVSAPIAPGANITLSLTLGWRLPFRDQFNYDATKPAEFRPYLNQYAKVYPKFAATAAWGDIPPGVARTATLSQTVGDILAIHTALASNSTPAWLQDLLINSVSHTRDSMWWQNCPDCHRSQDPRVNSSFWRQWEAYDCPDLDSIHNDGERHIPYITLFPDGTRSKLAAWAGNQGANGMLAEQILNTKPDTPQGRIMSDSTSMFIVYVLELLWWAGDTTSAHLYYPTVKRGAQWQMSVSTEYGVPKGLQTTYDIIGFPKYTLSIYASMFHLLSMKAAAELATVAGDAAFASECEAAFAKAQAAVDKYQWNETLGFYNAASNCVGAGSPCEGIGSFADGFYAQVLAYSLGLGDLLTSPERLSSHLDYTWRTNCVHNDPITNALLPGCPNGLVIMTNRPVDKTDLQVWEMATHDHVALALHRGMNPEAALALSKGTGTSYSQRINDQWAIAGIKSNDGYPSITTHYGYHMTVWHTVIALSGQVANFGTAGQESLTFRPSVACAFQVTVLLPDVLGTLSCVEVQGLHVYELSLTVGSLRLAHLSANGLAYPELPVSFSAGHPVTWKGAAPRPRL